MVTGKKGFIGDVPFILIGLFVFAIFIVIGLTLFTTINSEFQSSDTLSNQSKEIIQENQSRYAALWDGIFATVFGLLTLGLLLSVSQLGTRPEFFFIMVFISLFIVGLAAILGNVFEEFTNEPLLTSAASQLTFIPLFYNNIVAITLVLIGMLLIGLYAKGSGNI